MIQEFSNKAAKYIADNGGYKDDLEVYAYGIECLINELISDFLLLMVAIALNQLLLSFIWCVAFTIIRVNIGGFHASTNMRCIIIGTFISFINILIIKMTQYVSPLFICAVFIFTLFLTVKRAPIVHKNHPVSPLRAKAARKKVFIFIMIEFILSLILLPFYPKAALTIILGMLTASSMALLALFIRQ